MESILYFIENAHPLTIDYIERELMANLERVDKLTKMQAAARAIREAANTETPFTYTNEST